MREDRDLIVCGTHGLSANQDRDRRALVDLAVSGLGGGVDHGDHLTRRHVLIYILIHPGVARTVGKSGLLLMRGQALAVLKAVLLLHGLHADIAEHRDGRIRIALLRRAGLLLLGLHALLLVHGVPLQAGRGHIADLRRIGEDIGRLRAVARQWRIDRVARRADDRLLPAKIRRVPGPLIVGYRTGGKRAVAADAAARCRRPVARSIWTAVGEAAEAHVALGRPRHVRHRAGATDIGVRKVFGAVRACALRGLRLVVVVPRRVGDRRVVRERVVDARAQRELVVRHNALRAGAIFDGHVAGRGPAVVQREKRWRRQPVVVHRPRIVDHEHDVRVHRIDREQRLLRDLPIGGERGGLHHDRLRQQQHAGAGEAPGPEGWFRV